MKFKKGDIVTTKYYKYMWKEGEITSIPTSDYRQEYRIKPLVKNNNNWYVYAYEEDLYLVDTQFITFLKTTKRGRDLVKSLNKKYEV